MSFIRKIILLSAATMLHALPGHVQAAAGDAISNTASVDYVYQAITFTVESSPIGNSNTGVGQGAATTFTEDRLVNFTVTENDGAVVAVTPSQTGAVLSFTVTNNGNVVQDFLLTAVNTAPNPFGVPVDSFDPNAPMQVFVDSSPVAAAGDTFASATDTDIFIDELAPGVARTVYVVVDIPAAVLPTEVAAVALVAQVATGGVAGQGVAINRDNNGNISPAGTYSNGATNVVAGVVNNVADTAGLETVFNEPAGINPEDADSTGAVQDIIANGQHSDTGAFEISGSPVTLNKTVTVIDTLGGTDPHAGAILRYRIEVFIAGAGVTNNLVITDSIPANTTYTPGSIVLDTVALPPIVQTDPDFATDGIDYSEFNGTDIVVDLSEAGAVVLTAADSPITITFDVIIN